MRMENLQIELGEPVGRDGAPWLVLGHSLGTSSRTWQDVVPLVADHFRVVTWDLPGHGSSPAATRPFSIGDLSDALVIRLADRDVTPFHYAGVSISGTVGLDLAVRHRSRVCTLTAISTGATVDEPAHWTDRAAVVRASGTSSLVESSRQRWFAPTSRARNPTNVAETLDGLAKADTCSYAWACEALGAFDATPYLTDVDLRVLVLWGQYDALVPRSTSSRLAASLPHGDLRCVEGAAHMAPLENAEAVAAHLVSFIEDR